MLEEGRTLLDDVVLALARDYFLKLSRRHGDNAIYFYELGASMPTGRQSCFARGAKKAAGRTLNEGMASVQQSLKVNENPADAPGAPVPAGACGLSSADQALETALGLSQSSAFVKRTP